MRSQLRVVVVGLAMLAALPAAAADRMPPKTQWVDAGGARLYVQTYGDGPPIVFLHGGLHFFDNTFAKQRDESVPPPARIDATQAPGPTHPRERATLCR